MCSSNQVLRVLVVLAGVSAWAATVGCTPDVKDLRTEGIQLFQSRQYIESMAVLNEALEKSPSDAQSNCYMGLNYRQIATRKFEQGDVPAGRRELDRAIYYYTQAIKSWPNYMEAVALKNEAQEARGKYERAMATVATVANNNRGIGEHFVQLGDEYRERGDYDNALKAYKTALASDPNLARAYAAMGKLYMRVGDRALAMDSYQKAYSLNRREAGVADALAQLGTSSDTEVAGYNPAQ